MEMALQHFPGKEIFASPSFHSGMHQGAKDGGGEASLHSGAPQVILSAVCARGAYSPRVPFKGGGGEGVLVSHKLARSWGWGGGGG